MYCGHPPSVQQGTSRPARKHSHRSLPGRHRRKSRPQLDVVTHCRAQVPDLAVSTTVRAQCRSHAVTRNSSRRRLCSLQPPAGPPSLAAADAACLSTRRRCRRRLRSLGLGRRGLLLAHLFVELKSFYSEGVGGTQGAGGSQHRQQRQTSWLCRVTNVVTRCCLTPVCCPTQAMIKGTRDEGFGDSPRCAGRAEGVGVHAGLRG